MSIAKWHAVSLLGLLALAAADRLLAEEIPPSKRKIIMLTVETYRTLDEVRRVCGYDIPIRGCAKRTRRGATTLVLVEPDDWCDWRMIITWGHELLHAWGWDHTKDFSTTRIGQQWPIGATPCVAFR